MFEKILVTEELLPIRNAAANGDMDAHYALLKHVLEGKNTTQSAQIARELFSRLMDHPQFQDDPKRALNCYMLASYVLQLEKSESLISHRFFLEQSCDWLELMIRTMTNFPRDQWNYTMLEECISWIAIHEEALEEEQS